MQGPGRLPRNPTFGCLGRRPVCLMEPPFFPRSQGQLVACGIVPARAPLGRPSRPGPGASKVHIIAQATGGPVPTSFRAANPSPLPGPSPAASCHTPLPGFPLSPASGPDLLPDRLPLPSAASFLVPLRRLCFQVPAWPGGLWPLRPSGLATPMRAGPLPWALMDTPSDSPVGSHLPFPALPGAGCGPCGPHRLFPHVSNG